MPVNVASKTDPRVAIDSPAPSAMIEVVETLFPVFGLSDAAIRGVVIVLAIGFVPVVVIAWAFDLTPGGRRLHSRGSRTTQRRLAIY